MGDENEGVDLVLMTKSEVANLRKLAGFLSDVADNDKSGAIIVTPNGQGSFDLELQMTWGIEQPIT